VVDLAGAFPTAAPLLAAPPALADALRRLVNDALG
jgi:hypothetical protein